MIQIAAPIEHRGGHAFLLQPVSDHLARHCGGESDRGARQDMTEARRLLGGGPGSNWSAAERLAFERWSPLVPVVSLPFCLAASMIPRPVRLAAL